MAPPQENPPRTAPPMREAEIGDLEGKGVAGARLWVLAIKRPQGNDLGSFLAALSGTKVQ